MNETGKFVHTYHTGASFFVTFRMLYVSQFLKDWKGSPRKSKHAITARFRKCDLGRVKIIHVIDVYSEKVFQISKSPRYEVLVSL